jgi:hypothetical protein
MEHIPLIPEEYFGCKIYLLRGQKIIIDRDLAELYGVKPIRLREQVRRNQTKFPVNFMFQLTEAEIELMVSHFAIPSVQHLGGHFPLAFTEHGILQMANVLRSVRAIQMSIRIFEVFVRMRELLMTHQDILLKFEQMEQQVAGNSEDIQLIFNAIKEMLNHSEANRPLIGYKTTQI